MSIFEITDIAALQAEASKHNTEVLAEELQPYNDLLFDIITKELATKKEEIVASLKEQIKTTQGRVKSVGVPIWSYNTRIYTKTREEHNEELMAMPYGDRVRQLAEDREQSQRCTDNGSHWTIGVASSIQWLDEETRWSLRPVPVDLVVRKTDLLQRIAVEFCDCVWVARSCGERIYNTANFFVQRMDLHAYFYVGGLKPHHKTQTLSVRRKYAGYMPYTPDSEFGPTVAERVMLTGPGLYQPDTPSVTSEADEEPRRRRCSSCDFVRDY